VPPQVSPRPGSFRRGSMPRRNLSCDPLYAASNHIPQGSCTARPPTTVQWGRGAAGRREGRRPGVHQVTAEPDDGRGNRAGRKQVVMPLTCVIFAQQPAGPSRGVEPDKPCRWSTPHSGPLGNSHVRVPAGPPGPRWTGSGFERDDVASSCPAGVTQRPPRPPQAGRPASTWALVPRFLNPSNRTMG